jgi:hypothetical protein
VTLLDRRALAGVAAAVVLPAIDLEPIRKGVRHAFGRFGKDVARGLALRCDWGPQYTADAWING